MNGVQFPMPDDPDQHEAAARHRLQREGARAIDSLLADGFSADTLLYLAAKQNQTEAMATLVELHGANINADVPVNAGDTDTVLAAAAECGCASATEWLLQRGADVERGGISATNGSYNALWGACEGGYIRVARLLLDHGANVNTFKSDTGNTALFISAQNGHTALCAELIRHGAQVQVDLVMGYGGGSPPILGAVARVRVNVVALLRNAGARVPPSCFVVLAQMERQRGTVTLDGPRKPSEKELHDLKHLLSKDGVEKLLTTVEEQYKAAQVLERKGEYRKALYQIALAESLLEQKVGPPSDSQPMWTQLKLDEQRLFEAVYGVPGSDGRVAVWHPHIFFETDTQPPPLLFYAWVRHEDTIYRHGGLYFMNHEQVPSQDVLWAFNIKHKQWKQVRTTGATPGPRSGHVGVVHGNYMYVFGGKGVHYKSDNKVYRLDLSTFVWEVIKSKGLKPSARDAASGVVYQDKLYIYGGQNAQQDYLDDLWCFSFDTQKWKELSGRGGTARSDHNMWAARDKLFILGGEIPRPNASRVHESVKSIQAFEIFDLKTKTWEKLHCMGDDPWDLMEYTVLPLYRGEEEPSAVIVWGGYRHHDGNVVANPPRFEEMEAKWGDEARDIGLPYRRRLLRFDLDTMAWTRMKPLSELSVLPTAQSFAAELSTEGNVTKILIGGGYGMTGSDEQLEKRDEIEPILLAMMGNPESNAMCRPDWRREVFEVEIIDERSSCFADRCAVEGGWEWKLFDSLFTPTPSYSVGVGSPTLHKTAHVCDHDFDDPPRGDVCDDNENEVLGRCVVLKGLKGRPELNGSVGRAGFWVPEKGRYQIFIPKWEREGPCTLAVKATNLAYAPPLSIDELQERAGVGPRCPRVGFPTPSISGSWIKPMDDKKSSPLDLVSKRSLETGKTMLCMDTYHGPFSARADALLQAVCESPPGTGNSNQLAYIHVPVPAVEQKAKVERTKVAERFHKSKQYAEFVERLRAEDKVRVGLWERAILSRRDEDSWGDWLSLKVTIDGMNPTVERVLTVAPDITMSRLHQQVLCPAIGWAPNLHAYAFRRTIPGNRVWENRKLPGEKTSCWIGPRSSTSLDVFFQPLYVGGALADDRKIFLGDIFDPDENGEMTLQYVHDFGDWWSHTIVIKRETSPPPEGASVAFLKSGSGCCPPEDNGGIERYSRTMLKLTGRVDFEPDDGVNKLNYSEGRVDPSRELWWRLLNSEIRSKKNAGDLGSPHEFDLNIRRTALAQSLRRLVEKPGTEYQHHQSRDQTTGLFRHSGQLQKEAKPTQVCAVCGITAALKICSGCESVAFCCREHQVEYWPKHKAACKAAQKRAKAKKK